MKRRLILFAALLLCALGTFYVTRNKRTPIEVRVDRCERNIEDLYSVWGGNEWVKRSDEDRKRMEADLIEVYGPKLDCQAFGDSLHKIYARRPHWWQQPSRWAK